MIDLGMTTTAASRGLIAMAALCLAACGGDDAPAPVVEPTNVKAASVKAGSPIDAKFSLKNADPLDVDGFLALFPPAIRPTYDTAEFDATLGATVLTDVVFPTRMIGAGDGVEYDISADRMAIDRVELYGLDLDAVERIAAGGAGDLQEILVKARLYGVDFGADEDDDSDDRAVIGAIEIDRLQMRPSDVWTGIDEDGEGQGSGFARLAHAMAFGGIYVKDLAIVGGEDEVSEFSVKAPDLRLVGGGGGKLKALIANDLAYGFLQQEIGLDAVGGGVLADSFGGMGGASRQRTEIESVEWRDIDASALVPYGLKGETPPTSARDLLDLGSISVRAARGYVNDKLFSDLPEASISTIAFDWLALSDVKAEAKGARYDFTAFLENGPSKARDIMTEYGLDKVEADSGFSYQWDSKKGRASVVSDYVAPALATFSVDANFNGMALADLDPEKAARDGAAALFDEAALVDFEMVIDDAALLDAGFALSALRTGGSAEDARNSIGALTRVFGMQLMFINPKMTKYVDAVASFVEEGGSLTVRAAPKTPTKLDDIDVSNPAQLPNALNIEVIRTED